MPKVSVIIPCFNQAEYLPQTLNSVWTQTYKDWECIIINDDSPDNTEKIAKEYVARDSRFIYFLKDNGGVSEARNFGIMHSNGEYILPLDADDLIDSTFIEKAINHFSLFPETKMVYCHADTFGLRCEYWNLGKYDYNKLIWRNCIFCTAMFRRVDFDKTTGYNTNMIYGNEDWDLWLSLLKEEDIVYQIDEVLFHYRVKEDSRSTNLIKKHLEESLIQLCKNHPEIYLPYYERIIMIHNNAADEIEFLQTELKKIHVSQAYRLGKILLKPLSWIIRHAFCRNLYL